MYGGLTTEVVEAEAGTTPDVVEVEVNKVASRFLFVEAV